MKDNTSESSEQESSKDKEKLNPLLPHFDDIICYGVGCIRTCPNAKFQFALLLLLKMFLMVCIAIMLLCEQSENPFLQS